MANLLLFGVLCALCIGSHVLARAAADDKVLITEYHRAAAGQGGSFDKLLSVINRGVDVHALTKDGESALHLACIYGHAPGVKLLLGNGVDPNQRANKLPTSLYMTPLSWCAYGGHEEAVQMFLRDKRTDINLVVLREDGSRLTAVDIADSTGDMGADIARLLRAAGGRTWTELLAQAGGDESAVSGLPELIDYSALEAAGEEEVRDL